MPKYIVIGLDHFLQNVNYVALTDEGRRYESDQKRHFIAVLEEAITRNGVTLVCEECRFNAGSLGGQLAEKHGCRHVNVTMPHGERDKLNISPNYEELPHEKARVIALFEEYMAEGVRGEANENDVVLLMVGNIHRDAMATRMAESGAVIDVRGLDDFEWYEGPPAEEPGTGEFLGSWKKVNGDIA
jgi:hypothetical protein